MACWEPVEDGPPPNEDRTDRGEPGTVYQPAAVVKRLGISAARLRRLGAAYERAVSALPRDDRGRLYPEEAVEQLELARAAVHAGRYTSIEQALGAGEATGGALPDAPPGRLQGRTDALELTRGWPRKGRVWDNREDPVPGYYPPPA